MKRILSLLAAVGLVMMASSSMAAVTGTPHQFGGAAAYGLCEVCHVPHAADATTNRRLWRVDGSVAVGAAWNVSTIGGLCGSCHYTGGAIATYTNVNGALPSDQALLAYAATSHARDWTVLTTLADGQDVNIASKPYTTGTRIDGNYIECTSCHNPHNDVVRPFLRENTAKAGSTSGFCADCHLSRYSTTITNILNVAVADNMHPINVTYTDNGGTGVNNGASNFLATPDAALITLVNGVNNVTPWVLGGKFEGALSVGTAPGAWSSGTIGCGTCHSVHDSAAQSVAGNTGLWLLAMDNNGAFNGLCQGCHGGPSNASLTVGPGGADHPIDMVPGTGGGPTIDKWFNTVGSTRRVERYTAAGAGDPDAWPTGSTGNIVCTSCHSAHGSGSEFKRLTRMLYTDSQSEPNGAADVPFCQACHGDPSPAGHHSNRYNGWNGAGAGGPSYWPTGVVAGSLGVDCFDCHGGGSFGGAHNGFSFQFTDAQNQYSELCEGCHVSVSGTDKSDPAFDYPFPANHLGAFDANNKGKSHFLGAFTDGANSINVKRNTWTYGMSKFGGSRSLGQSGYGAPAGPSDVTGNTLICESCHSVLYNFGADPGYATYGQASGYLNNLLLQNYIEDKDAAGLAVGSGLCMGCHNQTDIGNSAANAVADNTIENSADAPLGMHPMTAWTITKAQDTGRVAGTSLITTSPDSYADVVSAGIGATGGATASGVSYPAANEMDCDSCHTPHRAASVGTGGGTGYTSDAGKYKTKASPVTAVPVILEVSGPEDLRFDDLCLECHNY